MLQSSQRHALANSDFPNSGSPLPPKDDNKILLCFYIGLEMVVHSIEGVGSSLLGPIGLFHIISEL